DKLTGFNILKMVPGSLSIALGNGIAKVFSTNTPLTIKGIHLKEGNDGKMVNVFLKPVHSEKFNRKNVLIFFTQEENVKISKNNLEVFDKDAHINNRIQGLENELNETKASLQSAIEQLETSNAELKSATAELLSANEELQSTNEELQSLNEELYTVNSEHTLKIQELEVLNDDLNNYFRASDIGQIFVDRDLKIRKFTQEATDIVNITENDIERPISHFSHNLKNIDLPKEINKVINKPGEVVEEVESNSGKWYQLKIIPYVRMNNKLDGAVITFIDITQMRLLNEVIAGVTENSPSGILALAPIKDSHEGSGFKLLFSNPKADDILGIQLGGLKNKPVPSNMALVKDNLLSACTKVIRTSENEQLEQSYDGPGDAKWLRIAIAKMGEGVVLNIEDVTERKNLEKEKETYFKELSSKNSLLQHWAYIAENNLRDPLRVIKSFAGLLKKKTDAQVDEETREFMQYMVSAAQEMEDMIMSLLDYSEIDKSRKQKQKIESNRLVDFAVNALKEKIKETGAKIIIAPEMPEVKGISSFLSMVFQQLISNALKFAKPG